MLLIEVAYNDEFRTRGLFTTVKNAGRFLSQTMCAAGIRSVPTEKYRKIRIVIGGVEFDPPMKIIRWDSYLDRGEADLLCIRHVEDCLEIYHSFFEP